MLHLDVDAPVAYVIALVAPALDALFPAVPSETAVVALGVTTAGSADWRIGALIALAALGAFIGDNLSFLVGRRLGPHVDRRVPAGSRRAERLAWAKHALERYGTRVIIVCRFIPGGRTAVTLSCGVLGYPWRSFLPASALAGGLWATAAFLIGRLGGSAFEDRPWAGLLLALAVTTGLSLLVELARRLLPRFRSRQD